MASRTSKRRPVARPVVGGYKTSFRRRAYFADVTSAVVNGPVMSATTKIAAYWLVTLVPAWHRAFGAWPWVCQFLLFFLCNDFGRYWLHRAYHASDFLWRLHRVHHATIDMDALSVIRTLREPDPTMAEAGDVATWERMIEAAIAQAEEGVA